MRYVSVKRKEKWVQDAERQSFVTVEVLVLKDMQNEWDQLTTYFEDLKRIIEKTT